MDFSKPKVLIDQEEYDHLKSLEKETVQPTKELVLTITNILSVVLSSELQKAPAQSMMAGVLNGLSKRGITVSVGNFNTHQLDVHPDQIVFQINPTKLIGEKTHYTKH